MIAARIPMINKACVEALLSTRDELMTLSQKKTENGLTVLSKKPVSQKPHFRVLLSVGFVGGEKKIVIPRSIRKVLPIIPSVVMKVGLFIIR